MHPKERDEMGVVLPVRPHSTIIQTSRTAPIAIPENTSSTIPIIAHHTPSNSPQKSSPLESVLQDSHLVRYTIRGCCVQSFVNLCYM